MSASKKKANIQPKVKIIIDQRENDLFLKGFGEKIKDKKMQWECKTLPVGDMLYLYGEKPLILIERKTLADLNKSISDGRYKEQKMRIMDSEIPEKYYLVEGNLYGAFRDLKNVPLKDYSRMYGAIVHTTIRDGIPVIRTENMDDTYKTLFKLYDAVDKFGAQILKKFKATPSASDYVETLKPAKKDNMTAEVCYLTQLRQIPGVSVQMAGTVAEKYPSFKALVDAYSAESTSGKSAVDAKRCERLLKDLVMPNNRKVGPVLSKRIYGFTCGCEKTT